MVCTFVPLLREPMLIPHADLIRYCVEKDVPFTVFEDWSSVLDKVKEIVEGRMTVQEAAKQGYEEYQKGEAGANGHAK